MTLKTWTHPDCYGGFSPDGDYLIYTRTRDSGALALSNWDYIARELGAAPFDDGTYFDTEGKNAARPEVYYWRAGHWACGWVEYMMIRKDAKPETVEKAQEIAARLDDYPALDEDDWSQREWDQAQEYWASLSIKERVELCQQAEISVFAARRPWIPQEDNGFIFETCRGD